MLLLTSLNVNYNFCTARSLPQIGSSLKPNHHSLVKLVQIRDTLGRIFERKRKSFSQSNKNIFSLFNEMPPSFIYFRERPLELTQPCWLVLMVQLGDKIPTTLYKPAMTHTLLRPLKSNIDTLTPPSHTRKKHRGKYYVCFPSSVKSIWHFLKFRNGIQTSLKCLKFVLIR